MGQLSFAFEIAGGDGAKQSDMLTKSLSTIRRRSSPTTGDAHESREGTTVLWMPSVSSTSEGRRF